MARLSPAGDGPFPIPARTKSGRPRYSRHQRPGFSDLSILQERACAYSQATRAPLTVAGYGSDWKIFAAWCEAYNVSPLPASDATLAAFYTWCISDGGYRLSTANRRLCGIRHQHAIHNLPDPVGPLTKATRRGARRVFKQRPVQKAALSVELLRRIARRLLEDGRPRSLRDRALLVLGFACGFRRSSLHRLQTGELEFLEQGLVVHERSSKTDQEGKGRDIPIFAGIHPETCPIRAVRDWLAVRGDWEGPLFTAFHPRTAKAFFQRPLSDRDCVTRILKRCLRMIGLTPEEVSRFSSHSLRAGCITAAAEAGASDHEIMQRSGHKTLHVMRQYIRSERLFPVRDPLRQAL